MVASTRRGSAISAPSVISSCSRSGGTPYRASRSAIWSAISPVCRSRTLTLSAARSVEAGRGPLGELLDDVVDHPAGEQPHHRALLGDPDQLLRVDHAPARVPPAQQRLDADHLAGGDGDLRLVVHGDLARVAGRHRPGHAEPGTTPGAAAPPPGRPTASATPAAPPAGAAAVLVTIASGTTGRDLPHGHRRGRHGGSGSGRRGRIAPVRTAPVARPPHAGAGSPLPERGGGRRCEAARTGGSGRRRWRIRRSGRRRRAPRRAPGGGAAATGRPGGGSHRARAVAASRPLAVRRRSPRAGRTAGRPGRQRGAVAPAYAASRSPAGRGQRRLQHPAQVGEETRVARPSCGRTPGRRPPPCRCGAWRRTSPRRRGASGWRSPRRGRGRARCRSNRRRPAADRPAAPARPARRPPGRPAPGPRRRRASRPVHDGELVAAEPGHQVTGRRTASVSRALDLDQQPVADGVPERVVDVLEPVQVEQQQRQVRRPGSPRAARSACRCTCSATSASSALRLGSPVSGSSGGELLLFGGEPGHPVDREERHQHQRDQRRADPGGGDQHRGEQQQRAGGEQLEAEALAYGGPPPVAEAQPHRGS